ncbi:DJ-1/PfpI family protein [Mycoplasmoides pneumoniae]|uniref:Uncharacterized protein MG029 homolog n=3 Tax=Mycoplasmoides pneumoniae TaxID=2104 RepID=Y032_MYCPN|nr:DJ-1/PfpI family protein [Mycoplasmoides pneumoniae]P75082.1 RecName: Full=Uncharacterized protein MG029 homolog [Mycoplasmoides pneumoniae M129]AAB95770.1 hydrolase [Mycoplasmoides pneumoniae M129]ADK86907.1 conserved hypothetical protein [Mycoplasmoides pneumoniae FH]AJR18996.1 hypothetical protein C985_00700 [Mycoplasmoides pneumoniae M129-B7]ALA29908.1 hypothetical protein C897_00175 [Mycoplasmoides pneumoniae PI 1428]ALA30879.1 hypothetical protein B434_01695 [Mycoplasmoides pneumonia
MKKLLVIVYPDMNDVEYTNTMVVFGFVKELQTVIYHPNLSTVKGSNGVTLVNQITSKVNLEEFDGVFIPGGMGATKVLDHDQQLLDTIRYFKDHDKYVFAICDTPNVL